MREAFALLIASREIRKSSAYSPFSADNAPSLASVAFFISSSKFLIAIYTKSLENTMVYTFIASLMFSLVLYRSISCYANHKGKNKGKEI